MAHCWELHSSEIVALYTFIETVGCYRCQLPVSVSAMREVVRTARENDYALLGIPDRLGTVNIGSRMWALVSTKSE